MSQMSPPPPPAVLETALYAADLGAARTFYAGIMGLEVVLEKPGRHVFFRVPGGMLLIFRAEATRETGGDGVPGHGAEGAGHVCFAAAGNALDAWTAHLETSGIAIEARITWPNGARSVYVRDPAGNSVEFAEPKLWET